MLMDKEKVDKIVLNKLSTISLMKENIVSWPFEIFLSVHIIMRMNVRVEREKWEQTLHDQFL